MSEAEVTVIIPTLCGTVRSNELLRAIASIKSQLDVVVDILVVVNGNKYDDELLKIIIGIQGVTVLLLEAAGIAGARYYGRKNVLTPYFSFLDDDDELYPYSIREQLLTFNSSDSNTGLVIADAYSVYNNCNFGWVATPEEIEQDPLSALLKSNWLIIQSALFKSSQVPVRLFDIKTRSNECTVLAFALSLANVKVRVNDKALSIIHDSAVSESKSEYFITKETDAIKCIMAMNLPGNIRAGLKYKLSSAFHNNSVYYLRRSLIFKSLASHFRSLFLPGGMRYIAYTRHILFEWIKRLLENF